jgi:hypothetical protein
MFLGSWEVILTWFNILKTSGIGFTWVEKEIKCIFGKIEG